MEKQGRKLWTLREFGGQTVWDWLHLLSALAIPVVPAAAGSGKVQMVTLWESEQAMHQSEEDAEQLRSATARAAGGE